MLKYLFDCWRAEPLRIIGPIVFMFGVLVLCGILFLPYTIAESIPGYTYHACEFSGVWWSDFSYEQDGENFVRGLADRYGTCLSGYDVQEIVERPETEHLLVCLPMKRRDFVIDYRRSCGK